MRVASSCTERHAPGGRAECRRAPGEGCSGSLIFLAVAPGVVAGLVPWLITGWDVRHGGVAWLPLRALGVVLLAVGVGVLLHAFLAFVLEGVGTPAPVAPTEHLVVGGLYRHVRNPMYLAVAATIVGQALLLGRFVLLGYAVAFGLTVWLFVHLYEEPTLRRRFGDEYETYRRAVPGWRPRLRPWPGAPERRA